MSAAQTAFEIPNFLVGVWPSNIDMSVESTYQFTVVDLYAAGAGISGYAGGALNLASSGYPALGILQNNPQANEAGTVMIQGISKAKAGSGGWSVGGLLMSDGSGNLVAATSTNHAIAKALTAANSGDVGSVLIKSYGKV